jgi:uncharacterized OB-fold protein
MELLLREDRVPDMILPPISQGPYLTDERQPRLLASECDDCSHRVFPPASVCPQCNGEEISTLPLGKDGLLYSYTIIHQGPKWIKPPYIVGYIDMPEGVRIFTHLTDMEPQDISCDMPVSLRITDPILNGDGREVLRFKFGPLNNGD